MSSLIDALEIIRNWLQKNYPAMGKFPYSGLKFKRIQEITKNLPFKLSEEVCELYQWRNGALLNHGFFPFMTFYPLEESLKISQFQIEGKIFYPYDLILFSTDRNFYYISNSDRESHPIRRFNEWENEICYVSLTDLILAIAECYEAGAYYVKQGTRLKFLQEDKTKSEPIFSKYHPHLSFHSPI
jgi:hypothetical protein